MRGGREVIEEDRGRPFEESGRMGERWVVRGVSGLGEEQRRGEV